MKVHEDFSRSVETRRTSDRSFGYTVGAALILLGIVRSATAHAWSVWPLVFGFLLLSLAALRPSVLRRINRIWTAVGIMLSKVMNPIFTGILFFLVVAPIGLILRLLGKDLLQVSWNRESKTYWIERKPPGPPPTSMSQQF